VSHPPSPRRAVSDPSMPYLYRERAINLKAERRQLLARMVLLVFLSLRRAPSPAFFRHRKCY
jgi:hypothetical protein